MGLFQGHASLENSRDLFSFWGGLYFAESYRGDSWVIMAYLSAAIGPIKFTAILSRSHWPGPPLIPRILPYYQSALNRTFSRSAESFNFVPCELQHSHTPASQMSISIDHHRSSTVLGLITLFHPSPLLVRIDNISRASGVNTKTYWCQIWHVRVYFDEISYSILSDHRAPICLYCGQTSYDDIHLLRHFWSHIVILVPLTGTQKGP